MIRFIPLMRGRKWIDFQGGIMEQIKLIPLDIKLRLDQIIGTSWEIFTNQYINKKYEINLEAPFQLHFASIIKHVGEIYCLKKHDIISVNLEVNLGVHERNYVDIVISYFDGQTNHEHSIPIELKFKTKQQSAEDLGSLEIYKDLYRLENLINNSKNDAMPFGYFFCITNNEYYINPSKRGLKTVFATNHGYQIEKEFEYKYLDTKAGSEFYKKNGGYTFQGQYKFNWEKFNASNDNFYFLKMKVDMNQAETSIANKKS